MIPYSSSKFWIVSLSPMSWTYSGTFSMNLAVCSTIGGTTRKPIERHDQHQQEVGEADRGDAFDCSRRW